MKYVIVFLLLGFTINLCSQPLNNFEKPKENPILRADSTFTFTDPIKKTIVRWQRADVFNPGAIVKDDKVYLLYRAEDNPAAILGGRTSRLGLAESTDGIHFTKHPEPVLFPDNDAFQEYDFPGGCEDPRLVQTEDGLFVVCIRPGIIKSQVVGCLFQRPCKWEKKARPLQRHIMENIKTVPVNRVLLLPRW